jgi:hypothetical protein
VTKVIRMRKLLSPLILAFFVSIIPACSNDATKPASPSHNDGTIHGQIGSSDFEFEVRAGGPGDPMEGPFILRGSHLHYDADAGALVVDLTVTNAGIVAQHEPIGLTFIKLDPDGVTVLNPDNSINDDGAAITFHFANNDGTWTPGEQSLARTVLFSADEGEAIAFIARLDIGPETGGGVIDGLVWSDGNKNGAIDNGEPGLPGVGVYLRRFAQETGDSAEAPLARVTSTGPDGHYAFDHVPAGGYVVSIAPSTVTLFPTTPTEIHVLLLSTNGDVSSYHGANFGAVRELPPPPNTNDHVHAAGKFSPPDDAFAALSLEYFTCPPDTTPQPLVTDPPVNEDCVGGRLRGPVTEVGRNVIRVMATWVIMGTMNPPPDFKVGSRVDVHVHQGPGPLAWVADSIVPWGESQDELVGRVEARDIAPDGTLKLLVLGTWILAPGITVGGR